MDYGTFVARPLLSAVLDEAIVLSGGLDGFSALEDIVATRFLDVDVFSRGQRFERQGDMRLRARDDDDAVYFRIGEHFPVIRLSAGNSIPIAQRVHHLAPKIAQSAQLDALHFEQIRNMLTLGQPTASDHSQTNRIYSHKTHPFRGILRTIRAAACALFPRDCNRDKQT